MKIKILKVYFDKDFLKLLCGFEIVELVNLYGFEHFSKLQKLSFFGDCTIK